MVKGPRYVVHETSSIDVRSLEIYMLQLLIYKLQVTVEGRVNGYVSIYQKIHAETRKDWRRLIEDEESSRMDGVYKDRADSSPSRSLASSSDAVAR